MTEDYTTYTEQDDSGWITIDSATKITFSGLARTDDGYHYYDYNAGYFSTDFTHAVDLYLSSGTEWGIGDPWVISNTVDDQYYMRDNNLDYLGVIVYRDDINQWHIALEESNAGSLTSDEYVFAYAAGVWRYLVIERDEGVGVHGTLYGRIYSDAARTTLIDTLAVTLTEKEDFRYVYALNNQNRTGSGVVSGEVHNLDLAYTGRLTNQGGNLVAAMTLALNSKMFYD